MKFHNLLKQRKYRPLYSSAGSKRKPGPKGPSAELIQAIIEMKQRNPRFGCPRIAQQIKKTFGTNIDKDVVRRILAVHYRPGRGNAGPSWLSFLGHTKDSPWSIDLFRCESILLNSHWVLVVMDQFTRRIIGFGVHAGDLCHYSLQVLDYRNQEMRSFEKETSSRRGTRPMSMLYRWFLFVAFAVLSGCTTIDFDQPKKITTVFNDTDGTYFGESLEGLAEAHPGKAGFYPVVDSIAGLSIRLLMAKRAERSIDAQYYLIKGDIVGNLFIGALLEAADRGVRVRLLVDDIFTGGYDKIMAALDSHPNFEIRVFNPFANRSARVLEAITSFSRINRRMHNKSLTVDNQMTLVGGRNIADEYFAARQDAKFGDVDVLGIGPVVGDVSQMFDQYWNNYYAVPAPVFVNMPKNPDEELRKLREKIRQAYDRVKSTRYAKALQDSILKKIQKDASVLTWAPYELVYDSPDKAQHDKAEEAASIMTPLRETALNAQQELMVITPYLVLRKKGLAKFRSLRERDVDVKVVTNSLAATNQILVHGGYAPIRRPLLDMGVKLFEARADATISGEEHVDAEDAKATLHTKVFIVDRSKVFIGSFNWDPRSAYINTELGVIIESPAIAEAFTEAVENLLPTQTYEVFLNEQNAIRWRGLENDREVVLNKEPQSGFWRRMGGRFMQFLPIRGQL
ncbi:MAG: phospholipase D-like domain-containing protein [Xanthomonadales bacterium]|nr:phospholipase D-like domain-containing protein [Xanthomonadales bacterium]